VTVLAMSAPAHDASVADAVLRGVRVHPPGTTADALRRFFEDDHVHAAAVVADRVLVTLVEREDLEGVDDVCDAASLGGLEGRVVAPTAPLEPVRLAMLAAGLRRLAVVDDDGWFVGLLCLKRSGTGFCSDHDVAERRGCA
jgi:CBS domain-containing protein